MKGLYCQQNSDGEEITFAFQERENLPPTSEYLVKIQVKACALSWIDRKLLSVMKLESESLPVGREIAGLVLEGILPLDSKESGLSEVLLVHEQYLVHKPGKISWVEAAGTIRDGLRAYTAFHYLSHLSPGKTVLVLDGASPFGTIAIQLAHYRGAKVISTAYSAEDKQYLEKLWPAVGIRQPLVARVIDVSSGKVDLAESCLEETGGLGVDIVLDAGVRLYRSEDVSLLKPRLLPHKHDILMLLAVGSHWVTTVADLQLDPPDSHCLFLKGATVSFLNDEVWNLSSVQQGKYLHILKDVMEKLSAGIFRPLLDEPIPLYEAKVSMEMVQKNEARMRRVVQL
ncbi:quinone oxidoreductase-like protein 1 isoform X2 [Rhinatrema bivittatum]|uniref:quinone oxidoreductase-like protein 1 isoform X2 n=1 Tax=Rhinatrema bivittatum TaxID=194408 RepID=UPI0011266B9F|nr:quinone oxidoreductase-like protein 1 isoform X2 [Rhinatrema bivittatum]